MHCPCIYVDITITSTFGNLKDLKFFLFMLTLMLVFCIDSYNMHTMVCYSVSDYSTLPTTSYTLAALIAVHDHIDIIQCMHDKFYCCSVCRSHSFPCLERSFLKVNFVSYMSKGTFRSSFDPMNILLWYMMQNCVTVIYQCAALR